MYAGISAFRGGRLNVKREVSLKEVPGVNDVGDSGRVYQTLYRWAPHLSWVNVSDQLVYFVVCCGSLLLGPRVQHADLMGGRG